MDKNTLLLVEKDIRCGLDVADTGSTFRDMSMLYHGLLQIKGGLLLLKTYISQMTEDKMLEENKTFLHNIVRELSEPDIDGILIDKNAFEFGDEKVVPLVFYPGHGKQGIPIGKATLEGFANGMLYANLTIFPKKETDE